MADISERLVKVETLIHERTDDTKEMHDKMKSLEDRICAIETNTSKAVGAKDIVTWAVMAGIALWGVLK